MNHPVVVSAVGLDSLRRAYRRTKARRVGRVSGLTDDNGFSNSDPNAVNNSPVIGSPASNFGTLGDGSPQLNPDLLGQIQNVSQAGDAAAQAILASQNTPAPVPAPMASTPVPAKAGMPAWKIALGVAALGAVGYAAYEYA